MLLLFGDEMLFVVLLCFRVETSSGDAARACGVLHLAFSPSDPVLTFSLTFDAFASFEGEQASGGGGASS